MATTSVTFAFDADAEGWVGFPGSADSTVARFQDVADWCFRHRCSGRKSGPDLNYAEVADTWLNLFAALTASDVVTGVRFGGMNERCSEYDTVDIGRFGDAVGVQNGVQYVGDSNIQLWAGASYGATSSWNAQSGAGSYETVPAADQSASSSVAFRVNAYEDTGNSAAAAIALLWDDLVIEIEYTEATIRVPRQASMTPIL